jgi:hypothetical protein
MPRKATSVSEIDQILHVHSLLNDIGVAPSPRLEVVKAAGKAFLGQLLKAVVGNSQSAPCWSSYGSIVIATELGKVEIDYLGIVLMHTARAKAPDLSLLSLFRKTPGARKRTAKL